MQQRQLRLGDILDDYCPRERRVTNHAIVAMVGPEVKQTRCTTCDAEHEYKGAKVPPQRKKKETPAGLYQQVLTEVSKSPLAQAGVADQEPVTPEGRLLASDADAVAQPELPTTPGVSTAATAPGAPPREPTVESSDETSDRQAGEQEGPVHRPLIRATLPRTEGTSTRQIPEFTIRQDGGRPGKFRTGTPNRHRPSGGGAGHSAGGGRHVGRGGMQHGGRGGNRPSSPHHRTAHHPHGARVTRPGKKRSR